MGRFDVLHKVLSLDPQRDNQEIVALVGKYEYPWLLQKSLEFALFRTYAVPSVSALLAQTTQFERHGQRRYDDTALLIAEFSEFGYDSERGRAAIKQMNRLHHRFTISNDDYLYVLSTFIFVPRYWHEQFGWRTPTHHENLANYYFWCEVGKRMAIQNIPNTYEAYEAFHKQYEATHFRYTESNRKIADYTIDIFCAWYPSFLSPLIRQVVYTFMDEPLRVAFGYPKANLVLKTIVHGTLKLGAKLIRYMPARRTPYSLTQRPNRTYPNGYEVAKMGLHDET
jgi:hypothetical protein